MSSKYYKELDEHDAELAMIDDILIAPVDREGSRELSVLANSIAQREAFMSGKQPAICIACGVPMGFEVRNDEFLVNDNIWYCNDCCKEIEMDWDGEYVK